MVDHSFRATLWEHAPEEPGSWHFVTVPREVAEELVVGAGPRTGFGSIRVEVSAGSSTWRTSLFPDRDGSFVLPVKKSVRQAEDLAAGDSISVVLEVL